MPSLEKKNYCTFYIVRHGETQWNVKELLQGHSDVPLNKKGEWQARELTKQFKNIHFAVAFSSDLLRAKRTAEIIALEKKIAVKTTKALRERWFGRFEGVKWREHQEFSHLFDNFLKLSYQQRFKKKPYKDTESDEELMVRFINFLREVAVGYPGKNVLVVTHGAVMKTFLIHLGFADEKQLRPGSVGNTAYIKALSDGVDFFIKETFGVEKKV